MEEKTQVHKLTRNQVFRLGLPAGAIGFEVVVTMYTEKETRAAGCREGVRMARSVYYKGEYIGGHLDLDD